LRFFAILQHQSDPTPGAGWARFIGLCTAVTCYAGCYSYPLFFLVTTWTCSPRHGVYSVVQRFVTDGVVLPPLLALSLFFHNTVSDLIPMKECLPPSSRSRADPLFLLLCCFFYFFVTCFSSRRFALLYDFLLFALIFIHPFLSAVRKALSDPFFVSFPSRRPPRE